MFYYFSVSYYDSYLILQRDTFYIVALYIRYMREVTLRVRHRGEPESDVSAEHPSVTLRSASSMTGSGAERKRIIEMNGPDDSIAAFLDDFRATDPVIDVELLSALDASRVFVAIAYDIYQWDSISQRFTDMGLHYRTGTTITAGWERWTLYLNESDDLGEVINSLEQAGNDIDLVRDVSLGDIEARTQLEFSRVLYDQLTQRQREVLAIAIDLGYYQQQKDVSIENVGTELDIAPTTTWEHLVRAEEKVMAEIGNHLPARHD
jgi:predicted DNA binding protein